MLQERARTPLFLCLDLGAEAQGLLVQPLFERAEITDPTHLIVVPAGPLRGLEFAALAAREQTRTVVAAVGDATPKKVIVVPGRMVNVVI